MQPEYGFRLDELDEVGWDKVCWGRLPRGQARSYNHQLSRRAKWAAVLRRATRPEGGGWRHDFAAEDMTPWRLQVRHGRGVIPPCRLHSSAPTTLLMSRLLSISMANFHPDVYKWQSSESSYLQLLRSVAWQLGRPPDHGAVSLSPHVVKHSNTHIAAKLPPCLYSLFPLLAVADEHAPLQCLMATAHTALSRRTLKHTAAA